MSSFELLGPGDVVDVGVGDDDLLHGEAVALARMAWIAGDVVAGIDNDRLARGFVAEDGAVALERTDGGGSCGVMESNAVGFTDALI